MDKFNYDYVPRTIVNHIQTEIMENANVSYAEVCNAIGDLSTWASHCEKYKYVVISHDGLTGDMLACYWPDEKRTGRPAYVRGAIWHADTQSYSFHS